MIKHVTSWLNAYLDDELPDAQLRRVEDHLAACDECRAELERARSLSALLRASTPAGEFLPAERFVSNLMLTLPRQPAQSPSRKVLEIGWWLIPAGTLTVWLFLQITFSLSSIFLTASETGLIGAGWLQSAAPQTEWFAMTMNLFGGQIGGAGRFVLSALNDLSLFIQDLTSEFIWQALFAMLYLGWLASWWLRHSDQTIPDAIPQS